MVETITLKVSGIKCDHCTYRDDSVSQNDYKFYVNKPCPDCGANLLTVEDFETFIHLKIMAATLNDKVLKELRKVYSDEEIQNMDSEKFKVPLSMNGSGKVKLGT